MVTAADIARIPIFASLDSAQRERLARAAADISLQPGEHAAHEGDERALFGVLEGLIESTKLVDGIERPLGRREPGEIFGEVPITLGTVFPAGFRAATTSRVLRVAAADYHTIAAVAPDVAKQVGRLAAHRMGGSGGLQGLAVRIARRLNRVMRRTGRVFADRYHSHILRSAAEVARAIAYVLGNFFVHAIRRGECLDRTEPDPFSSAVAPETGPPLVAKPQTWLLCVGWMHARV